MSDILIRTGSVAGENKWKSRQIQMKFKANPNWSQCWRCWLSAGRRCQLVGNLQQVSWFFFLQRVALKNMNQIYIKTKINGNWFGTYNKWVDEKVNKLKQKWKSFFPDYLVIQGMVMVRNIFWACALFWPTGGLQRSLPKRPRSVNLVPQERIFLPDSLPTAKHGAPQEEQ